MFCAWNTKLLASTSSNGLIQIVKPISRCFQPISNPPPFKCSKQKSVSSSQQVLVFVCGTLMSRWRFRCFYTTTSVQDLHQAYVQGLWQGGNLAEGIWDNTYGPGCLEGWWGKMEVEMFRRWLRMIFVKKQMDDSSTDPTMTISRLKKIHDFRNLPWKTKLKYINWTDSVFEETFEVKVEVRPCLPSADGFVLKAPFKTSTTSFGIGYFPPTKMTLWCSWWWYITRSTVYSGLPMTS